MIVYQVREHWSEDQYGFKVWKDREIKTFLTLSLAEEFVSKYNCCHIYDINASEEVAYTCGALAIHQVEISESLPDSDFKFEGIEPTNYADLPGHQNAYAIIREAIEKRKRDLELDSKPTPLIENPDDDDYMDFVLRKAGM